MLPVTYDRHLSGMVMAQVVAGSLQVQVYDAACENPLPAHQGHVDVAVPVDHPIGAYVGAVTEAGGKLIAPVVVYLDGL